MAAEPFGQFMHRALYGAHGFFAGGRGAGRRRDFLTSVEVGPLFGAVLARALDSWWQALGRPDPFTFVECGAGEGTLARAIERAAPACRTSLSYVTVEVSDELRGRQPGWVDARAALPETVEVGVVFANELLDNLPFDLVDATGSAVLVDAGRFSAEPAAAVQHAAGEWLQAARGCVALGRVVVVDYTTTTDAMRARPWTDWLRTYREHERGGHPLAAPGSQDITADVALDQLAAVCAPDRVRTQAEFLREHGIDELVAEGRRYWHGHAARPDLRALEMRSRVREAEALCDPAGLGGFTVVEWSVGAAVHCQ